MKALAVDWWTNSDYGHGFFVPLFSGYILWHQRRRWMNSEIKPSNFGLLVMLGAVVLLVFGSLWIMTHLDHNVMPMERVMQMQR